MKKRKSLEHAPRPCPQCKYDLTGLPLAYTCPECGIDYGRPEHIPQPCPKCYYDLTGLPSAHTCPECGFEYDEHTEVFRLAPKSVGGIWWSLRDWAIPLFFLSICTGGLMLVLFLAFHVFLVVFRLRAGPSDNANCIILNPLGVTFDLPGMETTIRWPEISNAKTSWYSGKLLLLGRHRKALFECELDSEMTSSVVKAINARLAIYCVSRAERAPKRPSRPKVFGQKILRLWNRCRREPSERSIDDKASRTEGIECKNIVE